MTVHGYELITEWKNSTCGKRVTGRKGGKCYFLKKYQTPVAPIRNSAMDAKTFEKNKKIFDKFVDLRKRINTTIRAIAGDGGNIIIPCEEFIDGNQYVEVSEFIDGAVDDKEVETVLMSLSDDTKKLLMMTAAGALSSIHSKNIVHSDLKLKNVLLVRNKAGNYVAKLIDFDSSYFVEEKPEEVIGTIDYYSPELGAYSGAEDEEELEVLAKNITTKSDIFSLGLIFHKYLSGEFPEPIGLTEMLKKRKAKGKAIYCWVALNQGCGLAISTKIKNPNYIALINDMLKLDPEDRPDAIEVLKRLKSETVIEEPWPEHKIILDKTKLKTNNIVGLKKISDGSLKKYEVLAKDGKKETLTKEDLISKGYAKAEGPIGFATPWPEHNIEFDLDVLKKRGFVSCEQNVMSGIKGYNFYRADSTSTFFKVEMLVAMKYAKKKAESTPVDEPVVVTTTPTDPWPEHKIVFDMDAIKAKGYVGFERKSMGGVNGYEFVRSNGTKQFIRVEMVIIQKMAKKV